VQNRRVLEQPERAESEPAWCDASASRLVSSPLWLAVAMSLFVDKHRPRELQTLDYHPELSSRLQALVRHSHLLPLVVVLISSRAVLPLTPSRDLSAQAHGDFPHTLFYGPSGAGKKTRIMATLRELFGPGVEKVRGSLSLFGRQAGRMSAS